MINNNKNEFMNAVRLKAEEFKQRSFESKMSDFLKFTIKEATIIDTSDQLELNDKTKMVDVVNSTIDNVTKSVTNGSTLKDETNALYDVNIAGEIKEPQTLAEDVAKNVSEAIQDEADNRTKVLEAQFDVGEFKSNDPVEVVEKIDNSFESLKLSKRNANDLNTKMRNLLSIEGEELIESIKDDVIGLVNESEAKNSIVREAIADINERKDQIEEKINGDASEDKKDEQKDENTENETSSDENNDKKVEENSNESLRRCRKAFNNGRLNNFLNIDDLVYTTNANVSFEGLKVDSIYDKSSFSREEAEKMLDEFRQAEDGIDIDNVEGNEDTLSTSEDDTNVEEGSNEASGDEVAESSENTYTDDDGETIDVDTSKFEYDDKDEIEPDEISEESIAKRMLPLSLNKIRNNTPVVNVKKLALFLTCKPDRGTEFFNCINGRVITLQNMLSKEGIADDDPINKQIKDTIDISETVKDKVHDLTEDLGILGILDGKFQRTDDAASNAVKSLANGVLLSKESLEENQYAEIFKIALSLGDCVSDISNNVDVQGNRDKIGDLEELLNEKLLEIEDPTAREDVESKVKALQSIESICPFEEVVNMQVFVSKENDTPEKITLGSLKDIDAYGYCYCDEIADIENKLKAKYSEFTEPGINDHVVGFDIHKLIEYVVEEKDTTKFDSNLYEQIIAKLVENKTVESSTEALILRNKAKAMLTGLITADKLGFMSSDDINHIKEQLI